MQQQIKYNVFVFRCVHSAEVITNPAIQDRSTNVDLSHVIDEHHRSL